MRASRAPGPSKRFITYSSRLVFGHKSGARSRRWTLHSGAAGPRFCEYTFQKGDQPGGEAPGWIEVGIEDRDVHSAAVPVGDQPAEDFLELIRINAWTAGRIDSRHDLLV